MAELYSNKIEYGLRIEGDYYNHLDIHSLAGFLRISTFYIS